MRIRRPLLAKSGATLLLISGAVTVACLVVLAVLASAYRAPLLIFDLRTEYFAQTAVRSELAALTVRDAPVRGLVRCVLPAEGFTGVIEPPNGARMSYFWRPGLVAVRIEGGAGPVRLISSGDDECEDAVSPVTVTIRTDGLDGTSIVLPISGPVQIGSELSTAVPPPDGLSRRLDMLLEGGFTVFGRTLWPWGRQGLYVIAGDALPIPAGSRIGSVGGGGDSTSWNGVAIPGPDGFAVRATAEADKVRLFRPGVSSDELTYEFGPLAAIVGDPAIGWLSVVVFIGVTVIQVVASWVGIWRDDEGGPRWRRRRASR